MITASSKGSAAALWHGKMVRPQGYSGTVLDSTLVRHRVSAHRNTPARKLLARMFHECSRRRNHP
jgi:hypothetical protein